MARGPSRRTLLLLGGIGLAYGGFYRWLRRPEALDFHPLDRVPSFRVARAGQTTGAGLGDPLVGIGDPDTAPVAEIAPGDVCRFLYPRWRPGTVPVAAFSDIACPYCRVLTEDLQDRHEAGEITVNWHELPLLGPASETAARVLVAADRQGPEAYSALQGRLMRARLVADPAYLRELATGINLDAARLLADLEGPEVDLILARSRGLARLFGFFATPGLVVGPSAVLGALPEATLTRLIADTPRALPDCG